MSNRQWVGGGNNNAHNAKDWSPSGVPVPGDVLNISGGELNLPGGDLAGDVLHVRNLSGQAGAIADPVINVSRAADLSVVLDAPSGTASEPTINVMGRATVDAQLVGSRANAVLLTENIHANSMLSGVFAVNRGNVTVNGLGPNARFNNDGASVFSNDRAVINADVTGRGTFYLDEGSLELGRSIGAGQQFLFYDGALTVDDPGAFSATLATAPGSGFNDRGTALFKGVQATSYDFANSRLTLYDGDKSVLSVRVDAPYAEAQQTATGVVVSLGAQPLSSSQPPLPIHSLTS